MTLVRTATSGRKLSIPSSWNDETSQTKSRGVGLLRKPESGAPMLPASATGRGPERRISAIQAVVVDFPLVPVTATHRFRPGVSASAIRHAISISESTGIPRSRAATTAGWVGGTPGETASQSDPSRAFSDELPK